MRNAVHFKLGAAGAYLDWVYIHCCGNGHLGFRPCGESPGKPVGVSGAAIRLAGEGVLTANADFVDCVHIHSCGNGHLWFRPYGESLGKAPSNQGLLPLTFGASLGLGMPPPPPPPPGGRRGGPPPPPPPPPHPPP